MPTAVMTESSENTASNSTICVTTTEKLAQTRGPLWVWLTPSRRSCSSVVALNSRNRPPTSKMSERPEKSSVPIENSGVVSVTNHDDGQQPQAHEQGQGQANDAGAVGVVPGGVCPPGWR